MAGAVGVGGDHAEEHRRSRGVMASPASARGGCAGIDVIHGMLGCAP